MVSVGLRSAELAIQVVAGSPSKALLGWSCGAEMYTEEAVAVASCWPKRAYRSASDESARTAEPRTAACPAEGSVKDWSKPYCSSVGNDSSGEHTQRSEVSMQSGRLRLGLGQDHGRRVGLRAADGATMVRWAVTPGTTMLAMPTWGPNTGAGGW